MTLVSTAAKSGSSSSGALTLLSTTTVTGSPGTLDVSGIAQTYNDLIIVATLRSSAVANQDTAKLRFNNDSAGNYIDQDTEAAAAAITSAFLSAQTGVFLLAPATSGTAGAFGWSEVVIPNYASSQVKICEIRTISSYTTVSGATTWDVGAGRWNSTAAISRITIAATAAPNTWEVGSSVRIYGRL